MNEGEFHRLLKLIIQFLPRPEDEWPLELKDIISRETAKLLLINFFNLDSKLEDDELAATAAARLDQIDKEKLTTSSLPLDIQEKVRLYDEHLENLEKQRQEALRKIFPRFDKKTQNSLEQYVRLIQERLVEKEELLETIAKRSAEDITLKIIESLPQTVRPEALAENAYQKALKKAQPGIKKILAQNGASHPEETANYLVSQLIVKETLVPVQSLAAEPRRILAAAPFPLIPKFAPEDLVLPENITKTLTDKPEGVSFLPLYTLLEPRAAGAWGERVVFFLPAKVIQASVNEATPEWQEMMRKGVFVEDIEASIARLKELGVKENEPIMIALKDKAARLREQQKIKIIKDGETIYKDTLAARILKHYHRLPKLTGQSQIFLEEIKGPLPQLSPPPIWTRGGYPSLLQKGLNKFGFATRFSEEIRISPYKTVVRPYLSRRFIQFITRHHFSSFSQLLNATYQATLGKLVNKFKEAFGRTFIGSGAKKAALWLAARAGVRMTITIVSGGMAEAADFAWRTFKKGAGFALGALAYIFMWAAHYGTAAVLGATAGLIGGALAGIKTGMMTFTALFPVLGPFAAIPAVIVGLVTWVAVTFFGAALGVGFQMLLDKIGAAAGGASLPQAGTTGFTQAGAAAASTAKWFVPTTLATATVGGYIAFQTIAASFVQPPTPYRHVSPIPPTAIEPECVELIEMIEDIADTYCVPPAILMAISRMEASGVWGWSCKEIAHFSTPSWWVGASQEELNRGYCYDTCARTGLCKNTTVMGPMQFEENTWKGIMPGYDSWDRCRLDLSLVAAAKKIKANSGTGPRNCGPWDEKTVRYVAYRYCGSCGTYGCEWSITQGYSDSCSSACGYDYCSNAWYLYQQYESQ